MQDTDRQQKAKGAMNSEDPRLRNELKSQAKAGTNGDLRNSLLTSDVVPTNLLRVTDTTSFGYRAAPFVSWIHNECSMAK
ncbi:CLUMA_CG018593, isoform A [Clunio marinus]|uniref:CLUMA_CG018593, isoform A n=1 Tax=Clunio marinus TaxID=568069 RepID=A0A1J1IYY4_9DIPT|nr:CLUMA_CG018593, isoform A [Clunio marinus]